MIRQTHTYANLAVSRAAYTEIRTLLQKAGYIENPEDVAVPMQGIALIPLEDEPKCDVCGDTAEQHRTEKGYDHEFGGIEPKRRVEIIAKLNKEFTPEGDEALLKLKESMPVMQSDLRKSIEHALNCFSAENGSNTPDFILAQFLIDSLGAYDKAVAAREQWYGRESKPVPHDPMCQSLDESLPGPCDCMPTPPKPDVVGRPFLSSI
jgi:hypothetical protein